MTEKEEGKIINAGELPCTLQTTRMLLLFRSLENWRVWILYCCVYYVQKAQKFFPRFFTCSLDTVGSIWNQDVLEDMIFTNLTWGLSYVHLQLGAKIVIRCRSEDSCKDFLSFWKVGLLLDIIVLPFLNCKQCWFCGFQGTGETFSWVFCILKFVCVWQYAGNQQYREQNMQI
jgi:hypothetical protein